MGSAQSSCEAPQNPAFAGDGQAQKQDNVAPARPSTKTYIFPVKYEEIMKEAYQALKWDSVDGAKFDVTKMLNPNFFLSHRMTMGMKEVDLGAETNRVFRTASPEYSFTATVAGEQGLMMGTLTHTGILMSRVNYRHSERIGGKLETRIDPANFGQTMSMFDLDFGGADWNGQLKYGMGGFLGANYMQTITPWLAAGGELFWLRQQSRSGVGVAFRVSPDENSVGTLQCANTGVMSMTYHQKVNDTASVAADFLYNHNSPKDTVASLGYDYQFKTSRLRGSVDSNGKIAALLEEMLGPGLKLLISGELDHWRGDHKFGVGMTVGEDRYKRNFSSSLPSLSGWKQGAFLGTTELGNVSEVEVYKIIMWRNVLRALPVNHVVAAEAECAIALSGVRQHFHSQVRDAKITPRITRFGQASALVASGFAVVVGASSVAFADNAAALKAGGAARSPYLLYQYEVCPWCNKVKAFLDYYKVPYQAVEVHPLFKSELAFTDYKKVPVLMTPSGEELRESNDIIEYILKTESNAGEMPKGWLNRGKAATTSPQQMEREKQWRTWGDDKLAKVMTANLYRSWADSYRAMEYILCEPSFSYVSQLSGYAASGLVMYLVGMRMPKKYGLEGKDLHEELVKEVNCFVDAVGDDKFIGGQQPSTADLHIFGLLRAIAMTETFKQLVDDSRILPWWSRMLEAVGESSRIED